MYACYVKVFNTFEVIKKGEVKTNLVDQLDVINLELFAPVDLESNTFWLIISAQKVDRPIFCY